jgi:alkylation response protein AidB-like acyl-CoA dehydrogenase
MSKSFGKVQSDWNAAVLGADVERARVARPPALDSAELGEILSRIAADKRRRLDLGGGKPDLALELVREHRLGAVRVPAELGGGGYTKREFYQLLIGLAEADPDVPHILRIHFGFVEDAVRTRAVESHRRWLPDIVDGRLFGGISSELSGQPGVYAFDTLLTRDGKDYRLNGRKFYSTGSLYSDFLRITADDEDGKQVGVVVPAHREGIVHVDDWDGIGQRETGSGTTLLQNVLVHPDELTDFRRLHPVDKPRGAQPQLLLHAIAAGVLRSVVTDTAELLRTRSRAYSWGNAEVAREDPQLLQVVGWISAVGFVVEAAVLAAAEAQERAAAYAFEHGETSAELEAEASLQAAKVKVGVEEIALKAAGELYNAGGASWTRAGTHLDRHWRNLRTLFSHNPTVYKARAIGDLVVNENPLPAVGFF